MPAGGGGGISGGGKGLGGGGSGGGGGDGFSGKGDEDYEAALRASGKSLDSIPAGAAQLVSFSKPAYLQLSSIGLHGLLAAATFCQAIPSEQLRAYRAVAQALIRCDALCRYGGSAGGRKGLTGGPAALPCHVRQLAGAPHEDGVRPSVLLPPATPSCLLKRPQAFFISESYPNLFMITVTAAYNIAVATA